MEEKLNGGRRESRKIFRTENHAPETGGTKNRDHDTGHRLHKKLEKEQNLHAGEKI